MNKTPARFAGRHYDFAPWSGPFHRMETIMAEGQELRRKRGEGWPFMIFVFAKERNFSDWPTVCVEIFFFGWRVFRHTFEL